MNGIDAIKIIRGMDKGEKSKQKIIICTGNSINKSPKEVCKEWMADGFLSKPISKTQLINEIENCINMSFY